MSRKTAKDKGNGGGTIALNKRARHEYHLEQTFEAGLALQGWELKAIRAGRANITEAYAVIRDGEIFLFGAQMTPLISASTHVVADAHRTRKLLLHKREIELLIGRVQRDGYTLVPTALYWKGNKVKAQQGRVNQARDRAGRSSYSSSAASGNENRKVAPSPALPSARTMPPWRSTMRLTDASPMPSPAKASSACRRWKGRNSFPA